MLMYGYEFGTKENKIYNKQRIKLNYNIYTGQCEYLVTALSSTEKGKGYSPKSLWRTRSMVIQERLHEAFSYTDTSHKLLSAHVHKCKGAMECM